MTDSRIGLIKLPDHASREHSASPVGVSSRKITLNRVKIFAGRQLLILCATDLPELFLAHQWAIETRPAASIFGNGFL